MTLNKDPISQRIIYSPYTKSQFITSSSFNFSGFNSIIITSDNKIKAKGNNKENQISKTINKDFLQEFTEFELKDETGRIYYPISAFIHDQIFYMVSDIKKGCKTRLAYYEQYMKSSCDFFDIENFYPVAIYQCGCGFGAIDIEGAIVYIPYAILANKSIPIRPEYLPNGEKAVDIAGGEEYLFVLSFTGKVFISENVFDEKHEFKPVKELNKIKVIQISGINFHFLFLTEDCRVFSFGSNSFGQLGTGNKKFLSNKRN